MTWAFNAGQTGIDNATGSNIDVNGNIYFCGAFSGTNVDFDPGGGTAFHSSNGLTDGFVAKYTSDGQYILSIAIGGAGIDKILSVTTDAAGNIYITGFFRGTNVDFDPSAATAFLSSNGDGGFDPGYGGDMFVAKYNADGQYVWAFNAGGSLIGDSGLIIKSDPAGNIFVGGYFRGDVDFDPSAAEQILTGATGTLFLARYNTNGQYQWAFNYGAGGNEDNALFDLRLDATDNVYITGFFQGTNIDFDPSAAVAPLSSNGAFDIYVAKYDQNGQLGFAFRAGGSQNDVGRGIVLDNTGNIYVLGDFYGADIDFDPSPATALLSSNGAGDIFVAKYSNTGSYLFAFRVGSAGNEFGQKIDTDNASIFITGGFNEVADFNPALAIDNLTSNGGYDIFLAKYDLSGVYQCAFNIGSPADDFGYDILIAGGDRFYLTGGFTGTNVDFSPSQSTYYLSSRGNDDAFLAKYYWPPNTFSEGTLQGSTICLGQQGRLIFTATSGTSPFTIELTDGVNTFIQSNVVSGVPFSFAATPGATTTYSLVSVKDAVRCSPENNTPSSSAEVIVEGSFVRTNNDTTVCAKSPVQLIATGAQSYEWSPAAGLSNTNTSSPVATTAASTQYIVEGTSANGCVAKDTVNVNVYTVPLMTIMNDTTICKNASVQLFATGGNTYSWSPEAILNDPSISNPVASPVGPTLFHVIITDVNNCQYPDSARVSIRPDPVFTITGNKSICELDTISLHASGGDIYTWQTSGTVNNPVSPDTYAVPSSTTDYIVDIVETVCNNTATLSTRITVFPLPEITASRSNDLDCNRDRSQLMATGASKYLWSPQGTLSNPGISNPVASPPVTTNYLVAGTDRNGCTNYDSVIVHVENTSEGKYLMPNAFTPNNDGVNDCYGIRYWGFIQQVEFSIYNRWGQRLFYTTNPAQCWDGTYNGAKLNGDVFVYVVRAKTLCDPVVFRKGTFALIR